MTPRLTASFNQEPLSRAAVARALGVLLGTAVADAAGAPFEFKDPGLYSGEFPVPVVGGAGELIGGGHFDWAPGEFTDDTQMAIALANALEQSGGFDPAVVWSHFRTWARSARDVGITISTSLSESDHVGAAEAAHTILDGRTASNGAVMRIAPVGVMGARLSREDTVSLAMAQASITHFDESAAVGAAFVADVIRGCIHSGDFRASFDSSLAYFAASPWASVVEQKFGPFLSAGFDPMSEEHPPNGTVWTAVGQALWAVRSTSSFHDAVVAAVDLGNDTDTVAAIAGAIAGAVYGLQGIPVRWVTYVHGTVETPGRGEVRYDSQDLINVGRRLLGLGDATLSEPDSPITPKMVHPDGVWASNLLGAATVPGDTAVVSLCQTGDLFASHPYRRQVYMIDTDGDHNPNLFFALNEAVEAIQAFLDEGRQVVVHCHGGRSRTGFVLKAWYMMREGVGHDEAHRWMSDTWPHYATWSEDFFDLLDNEWGDHVANKPEAK